MFYNINAYQQALKLQCVEEAGSILEFWRAHAFDAQYGGIMTCLDRDGSLYRTTKPVWFQGRSLYGYGRAYNSIEKRPEWLACCDNLYGFLMERCFIPGDAHGKMYFDLERDGKPISTKEDIFSETFAAMGLAEYYRATGKEKVLEELRGVFDSLIFYYENPEFIAQGRLNAEKARIRCPMAWYMMLLCTTQTVRQADGGREAQYTRFAKKIVDDLFHFYYNESLDLFVESDYDGPGHTFEVIWFVMAEALYRGDAARAAHMARMAGWLFDFAYDGIRGGLPTIKSYTGLPDRNPKWDERQWWVQNEMLIALFFAYKATGDEAHLERFRMAYEWVNARFIDREQGEWYAYLHPDGLPCTQIKGNETKGPFHNVRQFIAIYEMLAASGV